MLQHEHDATFQRNSFANALETMKKGGIHD